MHGWMDGWMDGWWPPRIHTPSRRATMRMAMNEPTRLALDHELQGVSIGVDWDNRQPSLSTALCSALLCPPSPPLSTRPHPLTPTHPLFHVAGLSLVCYLAGGARSLSLSLFVCPTDCLSDCLLLINVMCSILCWFGFCCVVWCEST